MDKESEELSDFVRQLQLANEFVSTGYDESKLSEETKNFNKVALKRTSNAGRKRERREERMGNIALDNEILKIDNSRFW